jgi:ABC-type phosphate transport system permease subunit
MDAGTIISIIAGIVGSGFLMYAKSTMRMIPGGAGLGLMVIPYFIANAGVMLCVCIALACIPYLFREA